MLLGVAWRRYVGITSVLALDLFQLSQAAGKVAVLNALFAGFIWVSFADTASTRLAVLLQLFLRVVC